ncbi:Agglutinin [Corchorus olitorius]|uniref:Agglutinin n=1 Tax=Corchorus olitorius TaxID=93759 RepID=A0A1R3HSK3_9ROSI|nr:Agglutinin [Corchorus olitorius]
MEVMLPGFIVLKYLSRPEYMSYSRGGSSDDGYVRMSETYPESPYARFAVEVSKVNRAGSLVHIRSFQRNRYLERTPNNPSITGISDGGLNWITATAEKPEEDRSKESCTLFRFTRVDNNTFRILHVQSNCELSLWRPASGNSLVRADASINTATATGDVFEIIDWNSLMILPKYVAFRGQNGNYLRVTTIQGQGQVPYLQFSATDRGDANASFEIIYTGNPDGSIRIKSLSTNRFWQRSRAADWILADSNDTTNNNRDTLFRAVKVNHDTIALRSMGNSRFCKSFTARESTGVIHCLNTATDTVDEFARLKVEEAVLNRQYSNIRYDFANARVYNDEILVVTRNSASNHTQEDSSLEVGFTYTEEQTSTWNNSHSLTLSLLSSVSFGKPLIIAGTIELSHEIQRITEWGKTHSTSLDLTTTKTVDVPPMTRVTVDVVATNGLCDVPFSYTQIDTLYNGTRVTTPVVGGMYTGSNYFNLDFVTREDPLTAPSSEI